MPNKFITLLYVILGLIVLFGAIVWYSSNMPKFQLCIKNNSNPNSCLQELIISSPPIQEAQQLKEACQNGSTNSNCVNAVGQKIVEEKIQNHLEK